jgi:hypothetical protein
VIDPPLIFGQHRAGLEMRQEVDETHVRPGAFDVSDGGAHARFIRNPFREKPAQSTFRFEQAATRRS